MSESSSSSAAAPDLAYAMALWERLAAYAWRQFLAEGPGVVLIEQTDLRAAVERAGDEPSGDALSLGYVPVRAVLPGDDFLPVLRACDPHRQVALIVRGPQGGEQLYVLEPASSDRPSPRECAKRLTNDESEGRKQS